MTVEEAIRHRRSVRQFTPDNVSPVALREMLGLATMCPNISNQQNWRYVIVTDRNLLGMLARLVDKRIDEFEQWPEFINQETRLQAWRDMSLHFGKAPAVVLFVNQGYNAPISKNLIEHGIKWYEVDAMFAHPDIQSVSAAITYFILLAEERGFGTCWLTTPLIAQRDLHATLELKTGEEIVAMVSIGKPAEQPIPKPRRRIDEIIQWK